MGPVALRRSLLLLFLMLFVSVTFLLSVISAAATVSDTLPESQLAYSSPRSCSGSSVLEAVVCSETPKTRPSSYPSFLSSVISSLDKSASYKSLYTRFRGKCKLIPGVTFEEKFKFHQSNPGKNRYHDVLPYEESRVSLRQLEGESWSSTYINASYLTLKDQTFDGDKRDTYSYIATQAPTQSSIEDFWRMCFEQDVNSIFMLVQPDQKCIKYWEPNSVKHFDITGLMVKHESSEPVGLPNAEPYMIVSTFTMHCGGEIKDIKHYNYLTWPDMKTPNMAEFLHFYDYIRRDGFRNKASVVHCSAGIGRTGTFCVFDQMIHLLENGMIDGSVDRIDELILKFRTQRNGIVQTLDQFTFIYEALHHYFIAGSQVVN